MCRINRVEPPTFSHFQVPSTPSNWLWGLVWILLPYLPEKLDIGKKIDMPFSFFSLESLFYSFSDFIILKKYEQKLKSLSVLQCPRSWILHLINRPIRMRNEGLCTNVTHSHRISYHFTRGSKSNYIFSTIFEFFLLSCFVLMPYKKLSIFKFFLKIATFFQKKPNFE